MDVAKSGYISGDRDGYFKWPSISERRSPTGKVANPKDLDRTGTLSNGLIELTIWFPRKWTTQSRATSLGTEMATLNDQRLASKQQHIHGQRWWHV